MTISTLKIDPRLLPIDWQTATTYTIVVGSDFVREVGNNRAPSPERTTTITTYATGPSVASVSPEFGTVNSTVLTATVTLNRPVDSIPAAGNFYLYKIVDGGPNTLVATIPNTSTRVTLFDRGATVSFIDLVEPEETYYLTSDVGLFADLFGFPSTGLEEGVFRYTIGDGPEIAQSFPAYDQDDSFVSTATITYDRSVFLGSGNFYLKRGSNTIKTIPVNQAQQVNTNTIALTLYDVTLIEGTYHIIHDLNAVKSTEGIPHRLITDDTLLRWDNVSLSTQDDQEYDSRTLSELFPDWWTILDQDPDPEKEYALRMFASSGTFVLNGVPGDDLYVKLGSKAELAQMFDGQVVEFSADVKDMNWDLPLTTTLMKDATIIATRNNTLIGRPYDLPIDPQFGSGLILTSNTYSNIISSSTIITAYLNTSTILSGPESGFVNFYSTTTDYGTSTFVNNTSSIVFNPGDLPVGLYEFRADWEGRLIPPKFNSTTSNSVLQYILPKINPNMNISLSVNPYRYYKPDASTNTGLTATIVMSGNYTPRPQGIVTLNDVTNPNNILTLATGTLIISESQSTVSLNWNPVDYLQEPLQTRIIRASFQGDDYYLPNTTSTSLIIDGADLGASLSISTNSASLITSGTYQGKLIGGSTVKAKARFKAEFEFVQFAPPIVSFYIGETFIAAVNVINGVAETAEIQLNPGTYTLTAFFDETDIYQGPSNFNFEVINNYPLNVIGFQQNNYFLPPDQIGPNGVWMRLNGPQGTPGEIYLGGGNGLPSDIFGRLTRDSTAIMRFSCPDILGLPQEYKNVVSHQIKHYLAQSEFSSQLQQEVLTPITEVSHFNFTLVDNQLTTEGYVDYQVTFNDSLNPTGGWYNISFIVTGSISGGASLNGQSGGPEAYTSQFKYDVYITWAF